MSNEDVTLSTGAAEMAGTGIVPARPRAPRMSLTAAIMMASMAAPAQTEQRLGSRYLDLATKHGVAAALKAESPHLATGKDPAGRQELRPYQRAARKARMAAKRRRGW